MSVLDIAPSDGSALYSQAFFGPKKNFTWREQLHDSRPLRNLNHIRNTIQSNKGNFTVKKGVRLLT